MKTKFAFAALALALTSASAFAADAGAGSGTVTFNGEVSDVSCTVSVNGGGKDGIVNLPVVNRSELVNGTFAKKTPFSIVLSDCQAVSSGENAVTSLKVSWTEASLADATKGYLTNSLGDNGAKNVYLTLLDGGKVVIPGADVDGHNTVKTADVNESGEVTFDYQVAYVTPSVDDVSAGKIVSQAVYTVSYQ